jgi:hypothetical protein
MNRSMFDCLRSKARDQREAAHVNRANRAPHNVKRHADQILRAEQHLARLVELDGKIGRATVVGMRSGSVSSISPVAICVLRTALPITSAGRF